MGKQALLLLHCFHSLIEMTHCHLRKKIHVDLLSSMKCTTKIVYAISIQVNGWTFTVFHVHFLTDDLAITCKGFCTISWNLKADVQDGCLIFITGDPVTLGCWESNMAVQLAPSVESNNIWTAEIKVNLLLTVSSSEHNIY